MNLKKSDFEKDKVNYLGYVISISEILMEEFKVLVVKE